MKEIWKAIPNHSNYKISSLGKIKRLARVDRVLEKGKYRNKKLAEMILSCETKTHSYKSIMLISDTGPKRRWYLHRLMAEVFLPKIEGKNQVNHINGYKKDNRLENLEWCDNSHNMLHALNMGLSQQRGETHYHCRKVIDINTGKIYGNIQIAANQNGLGYSSLKAKLRGQNINDTSLRYYDPAQAPVIPMRRVPSYDPAQIAAILKSNVTVTVK
jgi:hypothetical protein